MFCSPSCRSALAIAYCNTEAPSCAAVSAYVCNTFES